MKKTSLLGYGSTFLSMLPNLSIILLPILLAPLYSGENVTSESKCAFVVIYIATLWALSPIPLPITSMFPIVLLPMMQLSSTEAVCAVYLKGNNMLFLGCLTLALAVEKSGLHQRVALKVLLALSTRFHLILLGFMMLTSFFSMWIVSTATVAMMLPIADEIFRNLFPSSDELNENHQRRDSAKLDLPKLTILDSAHDFKAVSLSTGELQKIDSKTPPTFDLVKVKKMFYLCIAYSSTIGAVSTLASNGPNLVMKDVLEENYDNRDPVDYASWLIFAAPCSLITTIICWRVFSWLYFADVTIPANRTKILKSHIEKKYSRLGPITFHEVAVLFVFVVMILLYVLYKPQFISGWVTLFANQKLAPKLASAAIFSVLILFFIPAKPFKTFNPDLKKDALLDWPMIQSRLEWGVIFIRGGGFALADAVKTSGLSALMGSGLMALSTVLSVPALIASLSVIASALIELMRTSSTASIVIPVTINLAEKLGINPLKLVIPMATSCAYAFVTPVGTTANTLIYFHGKHSISEMIVPGLIAKAISMAMMMLNTALLGPFIFDFNNPTPDWLDGYTHNIIPTNATMA